MRLLEMRHLPPRRTNSSSYRPIRLALAVITAVALLASPETLWAHHSTAEFDYTKTITVEGVVKEVQWTNPHSYLQVLTNAQRLAERHQPDPQFDRTRWCAGPGMPRIMLMPYPFEIRSERGYLAFLFGWYRRHGPRSRTTSARTVSHAASRPSPGGGRERRRGINRPGKLAAGAAALWLLMYAAALAQFSPLPPTRKPK